MPNTWNLGAFGEPFLSPSPSLFHIERSVRCPKSESYNGHQAREEEMRRTFLLITEITRGISLPFPFEHIVCG
jgi:hypothetical protein